MKGQMLRLTRDEIRHQIKENKKQLEHLKKSLKCKHDNFIPPLGSYSSFSHNCLTCGWKIYQ
jgi:hypothetical protein